MGLNLRLKCLEFAVLLFDFQDVLLTDRLLKFLGGVVELVSEIIKLRVRNVIVALAEILILDAIKDLLSLSYELTAPKKCNKKSSAKNPGDSANGKEKEFDEG